MFAHDKSSGFFFWKKEETALKEKKDKKKPFSNSVEHANQSQNFQKNNARNNKTLESKID